MLKGVYCKFLKVAKFACLNKQCHSSSFICSQECSCYSQHQENCLIRNIQELDDQIKRILNFQWLCVYSPQLRGQGIQVVGRMAKQTLPAPRNSRFALTCDKITLDRISQVSFKLRNINGCVGVGLFNKKILQNKSFKYIPQDNFLGHGTYMVLSNSYKYSNSNENDNCKQFDNFKFTQNGIIHLKYSNNLLTFFNGTNYQYLKIQIKQDQDYHFGVYLFDEGDQIQILRKK